MTHKLHKFVPPFTLYFNVKNAPNPAQKHFEKTNKSSKSKMAMTLEYRCHGNRASWDILKTKDVQKKLRKLRQNK